MLRHDERNAREVKLLPEGQSLMGRNGVSGLPPTAASRRYPRNHPAPAPVQIEFASTATYAGAMCPGMRPLAASRRGFLLAFRSRHAPSTRPTPAAPTGSGGLAISSPSRDPAPATSL